MSLHEQSLTLTKCGTDAQRASQQNIVGGRAAQAPCYRARTARPPVVPFAQQWPSTAHTRSTSCATRAAGCRTRPYGRGSPGVSADKKSNSRSWDRWGGSTPAPGRGTRRDTAEADTEAAAAEGAEGDTRQQERIPQGGIRPHTDIQSTRGGGGARHPSRCCRRTSGDEGGSSARATGSVSASHAARAPSASSAPSRSAAISKYQLFTRTRSKRCFAVAAAHSHDSSRRAYVGWYRSNRE